MSARTASADTWQTLSVGRSASDGQWSDGAHSFSPSFIHFIRSFFGSCMHALVRPFMLSNLLTEMMVGGGRKP